MTTAPGARARSWARLAGVVLTVCGFSLVAVTSGLLPGLPVDALLHDLRTWFLRLGIVSASGGLGLALFAPALLGRGKGAELDRRIDAWSARLTPRRGALLVWVAALLWAVVYTLYCSARHLRLNSTGYDLAIESQVLWNLAHGHGFASSIEVPNYLGDHFVPSYALLAPLYWLWDDVRMLLAAQSLWLALGAPAVYRIARRRSGDSLLSTVLGLGYLLIPAVGFMCKFDAHWVTASLPVLLWAMAMWEEERRWSWAALLLFSLTIREEVGLAVGLLALLGLTRRGYRRLGLVLAVVSFSWSVLALFVWIPHFRAGLPSDTLSRYAYLGETPREIVWAVLRKPWVPFVREFAQLRRLLFLFQLGLPSGFLCLLAPEALLPGTLVFLENLWSDNLNQAAIYHHYIAPVVAFVVWAGARGAARGMGKVRLAGARTLLLGWIAFTPIAASCLDPALFHSVPWPYAEVYGLERDTDQAAFRRAARLVPRDASVIAAETLAAQFAHRRQVQSTTRAGPGCGARRGRAEDPGDRRPVDADWVLLDLAAGGTRSFLSGCARRRAVDGGGYGVAFYESKLLLLTRTDRRDGEAEARFRAELAKDPPRESDSTLPDPAGGGSR
ncbi:MAG: DUF2079 domain-containing protein [Candidatus Eisenbacteria bacterium]